MHRTAFLFSFVCVAMVVRAATPALMPMPAKVVLADGALAIDASFGVSPGVNPAMMPAVNRFLMRLWRQTGIFPAPSGPAATLTIACTPCSATPTLGEDESYTLDVTPAGASLKSITMSGALHGLETFLQLVEPGAEGFRAPAVHIADQPRFAWRGLMLDCSRHFLPLPVVERNLDAMATVKLNVFHWHLSDDQGFRAESKLYPRLQQLGSDGQFYTQDQMREVVDYAAARGIRVVPEFDMPGHTMSWLVGYPELAAGEGPFQIGRTFGVFDPVLDPTREETYTFLDGFIGEMAALFPDPYFHIGGDEVNGKAWKQSQSVQAFAKAHGLKDTLALQTYFNQRVLKIVQKYHKTMVGWDEILGPDLPRDAVIQSWRGAESLADAAAKGYRGILSAGYYVDHLRPASYHYGVDPLSGPAAQLTPEQAAHILGGEACMWAEMVDAETVDSRVWPRTAAIAERYWSPRDVTDVDSMYARMEAVSRKLEWTGVTQRSSYGEMLDRLADARPVEPLRVLADAVEARGLGTGRRAHTTQTPLNRLVDAARPESETVRHIELFARKVAAAQTADPADLATLRAVFHLWMANDARLQSLAEDNALLAEVKPLSKDLAAVGAMGIEVLDYWGGKPVPADWIAAQSKELTRLARPQAEVLLAAYRPVKILMDGLAKR
ncbi:MAG TPA: family 20 glycosylhydrolase [Bryobacteraceae bacterium]|jgi:hexosaminidase|nr:family 20 glycosylhydrolase [Bryobacteraceae bacterium]